MMKKRIIGAILIVIGGFLFFDGLVFHWMGDISYLDPTGLEWLHHWMLGAGMMLVGGVIVK